MTENRSAQRCLREIGVREEDLHKVLSVCVDILRLLIDNDPGVEIELDPASLKFYDDLSSKVRPHLLDHLRTVPPGAGEKLSLQYQFALVAALIWGHRIDVKPLKLFSSQARILNKTTDRRGNLNRGFFINPSGEQPVLPRRPRIAVLLHIFLFLHIRPLLNAPQQHGHQLQGGPTECSI